jgi:LacI family sucrose operon transcriptional repressor
MKKMTISDIAKEAGVAKSTVSRYLNDGYVKDATRKKIHDVIEKNGFEPSAAAQNLKLKRTKTVGIVAPTMTSRVSGRQITAIDETLRAQGYSCMILTTNHHPEREIAAIEYLRSLRVDGIILIATTISQEHQRLQTSSKIPFIVMGQQFREGTSIVYDDYQAGYTIGEFAREQGHRDVIYIGVSEVDEAVGIIRKRGVMDGLHYRDQCMDLMMEETSFSYQDARVLVRDILKYHVPSMFICATDQLARATLRECRDAGLRVPEDVSVAGFGGYEMSELVSPALTTIRFKNEEAGTIAANTLLSLISQKPVPVLQRIGFDFVHGESVAKVKPKEEGQTAPEMKETLPQIETKQN